MKPFLKLLKTCVQRYLTNLNSILANLKEIRSRISSVSSTMQITQAMKMVSAAKLKKAQSAIISMRPYSESLFSVITDILNSMPGFSSPLVGEKKYPKRLLISITSNRGLCGGFNSNIIKATKNYFYKNDDREVDLVTIGKKGNDVLSKSFRVAYDHSSLFDNLDYPTTSEIADKYISMFITGGYDKIELIYNKFKNAATQVISTETLLPYKINDSNKLETLSDYIYEPNKSKILEEIIPKGIKIMFYKALRESFASEHGARMTAMHKATDNAAELADQLKLTYNKARQASITSEILEIVGGAEALKK